MLIDNKNGATTASENEADSLATTAPHSNKLQFRVSTGLKRVLGRELITNDEVAIFELVKNSFDAGAKDVYLHFDDDSITVADDGAGMSYDDLRNKWLFVAYSSKRNASRLNSTENYRNQVADHHHYAGSKGIGRFSSDRLGRTLSLQTRTKADAGQTVHCLDINWADFEGNDTDQFSQIDVIYRDEKQFELPDGVPDRKHGTIIRIGSLLTPWSRENLLKLKSGLAKLINPFGAGADDFTISIIAKYEEYNDAIALKKHTSQDPDKREENVPVVNGHVGNFIFSTLQQKTTFINVSIDADSNTIKTTLTDRGEIIYSIRENNTYPLLVNADFQCQLYYLNRSAKATFTRRMSLHSVRFGSIFVFRNGFRVFPIGEEGDDWFRIDRRKQQGYARFLGTRDIIGRVDVSGDESMFQEASSRNQGLIATPAVEELKKCFWEYCLKRLERYVVPVSWGKGTNDVLNDTLTFIESDSGRARVSAAVADLIGSEGVEVLQYSKRLIDILNERSEQFEASLTNLRVIANSTGDMLLAKRIEEAELRFAELKQSEAEARRIADEERRAKEEAEARAQAATAEIVEVKGQLVEERSRNSFLASISTLDLETLNNLHHQITIYSTRLQSEIAGLMGRLARNSSLPLEHIINRLESIAFINQQIQSVTRFATKANFRLDSEYIDVDLAEYIISYITEITRMFVEQKFLVVVETDGKEAKRRFKPIDISIVIDNLVSNTSKAHASTMTFDLKQPRKGLLEIYVSDDGNGIPIAVAKENHLFEKGVTTSSGSGLGLYHVKQVLGEMGGSIEILTKQDAGAHFLLRIPI